MDVPLFGVITAFCFVMITKHDAAVQTVCRNLPFSGVGVPLNCSIDQWIHVLAETYVNQSSTNGCLNTSSTTACTTVKDNDARGLEVNCNGKQTCNEKYSTPLQCLTLRAFEIKFDCIKERINVCGTVSDSMTGPVYLNSPGFPKSVEVQEICSCMISGTNLTVMLIENRGRTQQLNISSDVGILEKAPRSYNRNIVEGATRVNLTYSGMYNDEFWLSVNGTGNITVICSRETFTLPSTSMPTMKTTTRTPITSSSTMPSSPPSSTPTTMAKTSVTSSGKMSLSPPSTTSTTTAKTYITSSGKMSSSPPLTTSTTKAKTSVTSSGKMSSSPPSTTSTTKAKKSVTSSGKMSSSPPSTTPTTTQEVSTAETELVKFLASGAAGVLALTVIMVVVIICCRRKKSNKMETNGSDSPRHDGRNNYLATHNYFQLDPAFVTTGPDGAPSSVAADRNFNSRFSSFDNVTFSPDISNLNGSFDTEHGQGMVINEMYHSYQSANRSNDINVSGELSQPENQLHSDDVEEGMVINDLYHSYQ